MTENNEKNNSPRKTHLREQIKKGLTGILVIKLLFGMAVGIYLLKKVWPSKAPQAQTTIVGEGEFGPRGQQQIEPQFEPRVEPRIEPRVEVNGVLEPRLEGAGAAVQVPVPVIDETTDSLSDIVGKVRPAVVKVIVVPTENLKAPETGIKMGDPFWIDNNQAVGSGVIINEKGLFLTTKHVVGNNNNLQVTLYHAGQKQYTARVVARDPDSPLVLCKIRAPAGQKFSFAKMGDSDRLHTGDVILAIGSPFSLSGTVTSGIISGKKDVVVEGATVQNAIVLDASINDGNAGGPLVNVDGDVIGITFASYVQEGSFTGLGFAVPINFAKEMWAKTP